MHHGLCYSSELVSVDGPRSFFHVFCTTTRFLTTEAEPGAVGSNARSLFVHLHVRCIHTDVVIMLTMKVLINALILLRLTV